jgi:hypothetical protein
MYRQKVMKVVEDLQPYFLLVLLYKFNFNKFIKTIVYKITQNNLKQSQNSFMGIFKFLLGHLNFESEKFH